MFVLVNLIMGAGESVLGVLTNEACFARAVLDQTMLALCKVRLTQAPFAFSPTTTKADAIAAEADFDGYTAGGNTVTAWGDPLAAPGGGASIAAETTFAYVDDTSHTANQVKSGWIENAGGDIVAAFNFPAPINFAVNGDGFVLQLLDTFTP
jgi:hypothetical protein